MSYKEENVLSLAAVDIFFDIRYSLFIPNIHEVSKAQSFTKNFVKLRFYESWWLVIKFSNRSSFGLDKEVTQTVSYHISNFIKKTGKR